ncbi:MAG: SDR family oxidoreductase [Chloroflexota bacterium]
MATSLNGKVAVVTGAGYGLGKAIAIGLAREGCNLVLTARSKVLLDETKSRVQSCGQKAIVIEADISNARDIEKLVAETKTSFGKVDFLINSAFGHIGEDQAKSLLDVTQEELITFGNTSIVGTWCVTQAFAPLLQNNLGKIIFIGADWGYPQHNIMLSSPQAATTRIGSEAFTSAKYAITGFANSIERMLRIQSIGIYPGVIASVRPSSIESGNIQYFDIDDPIEMVDKEYGVGEAILLNDVVESVIFALRANCTVKALLLKPKKSEYDGLAE